jgi:lysozyme family protein
MTEKIDRMIDRLIQREGGFVDHPDDPGRATKYGITERVARENGYEGEMIALPRSFAEQVYRKRYVADPGFINILPVLPRVADELVDSGVNAGPGKAARWLQEALNLLNRKGRDFADILVDGQIGPKTMSALTALTVRRGKAAEELLVRTLDGLQFCHYRRITQADPDFESFFTGWIAHRIQNA